VQAHRISPSLAHGLSILVGIPALNEEVAIGSIVLRSLKYAEGAVVIDDGSTDRTAEIASLAGATVISHRNNQGKGTSIKDIFAYAMAIKADILVLIDADGQHDPDELPRLVEPLLKGEADMVIGSRFLDGIANHVPKYRRFGQEALTMVTNIASGMNVTDTQSGFRAFTKKAYDCFSFGHNGMAVESEMIVDAVAAGLKIREVPINVRYDVDGSTYHPVQHGFRVLSHIVKMIARKNRGLVLGVPGLMLLLAGMVIGILTLQAYLVTNVIMTGYVGLFTICTALGAFGFITAFYRRDKKSSRKEAL
jgi:glycosyltransferase involved in cell wall biosynthesis